VVRLRVAAAGSDGGDGGFIGSAVVDARQDDDGCGTSRCPWIITGRPGQVRHRPPQCGGVA